MDIFIINNNKHEFVQVKLLQSTFCSEFDGCLCGTGAICSDYQHIAANINGLIIIIKSTYDVGGASDLRRLLQCGAGHTIVRSAVCL